MDFAAGNDPQYDVVISYAEEDRTEAESLATSLRRQGVSVFHYTDPRSPDPLAARLLESTLADVFERQGRQCIIVVSEHYVDEKKIYPKLEWQAALRRASRSPEPYLLPVRLDDAEVPAELGGVVWVAYDPERVTTIVLKHLGRTYRWKELAVVNESGETPARWNGSFTDAALSGSELWLSLSIHSGGGYGDVGAGALLRSGDSGASWREIETARFPSGAGTFTWGPRGGRLYEWSEIGPINAIATYRRYGKSAAEIWLASATGIYCSEDGGVSWERSTPGPDHADRYAFFFNMANVEAFAEVYAVGWQGIAHWSRSTRRWNLQVPTYTYPMLGICVLGGSENRNVWAVGRAGSDAQGNWGSDSHGAIYFLMPPGFTEWIQVDVGDVAFKKAQALVDVTTPDAETVIAVGQAGLIVRGSFRSGAWHWSAPASPTQADISSVAASGNNVLAVGDRGTVLASADKGITWKLEFVKPDAAETPSALRRVRFVGSEVWVLGDNVVLIGERL